MKLAIGTVQFGTEYGVNSSNGKVDPKEVQKILKIAKSNKINLLDTAVSYGTSEEVIGKIDVTDFKVVTKTRYFENHEINNHEVKLLKNDFYNSLKKLNQDSVYGLLIHNAGDLLKPGADKIINQLQKLKQSKQVMKIGVSIYNKEQLQFIINNFDIDLVQLPFSIFDRRMFENGMLNKLKNNSIEVHGRSVFLQGLLLMSQQNRPNKFDTWNYLWKIWHEWLNDNKITALEATIRYAYSIKEITKIIVGVDNEKQLIEIIKAFEGVLPQIPSELYTNDANLLNPSNWKYL